MCECLTSLYGPCVYLQTCSVGHRLEQLVERACIKRVFGRMPMFGAVPIWNMSFTKFGEKIIL